MKNTGNRNLLLCRKYQHRSNQSDLIRQNAISHLLIDQKSTVDYIGVVQGIPICFDAKECAKDIFPLQNIHEHQVEFMRQYEEQGGISFLLIYFTSRHVCYYMSFQEMMKYWNRAKEGGVKHFKYEELDIGFFVPLKQGMILHYLECLQKVLEQKDQ